MVAKVLIVEDEFLVALELQELLTGAGHTVVGLVQDQASLEKIGDAPQVALVDVNLRDGPSGPRIARQLSHGFGTKIVYVTATACQIDEPAATAVGVVHKPFSEAAILSAVDFATNGGEGAPVPPGLKPLPLN
ncbi:MAG: response regulator [Novosphingobium sp.]|nr:response regulator [Novosphingobium sp.]